MAFDIPDGGPVRLRHSFTSSDAPTANELEEGELAINSADGVLYFQTASGSVATVPGSVGITSIVSISQAAYDALASKDPNTLYVIT
jgi:hypothetical protein